MNCYVFSRCVSLAKVDTFCGYICMFCLFVTVSPEPWVSWAHNLFQSSMKMRNIAARNDCFMLQYRHFMAWYHHIKSGFACCKRLKQGSASISGGYSDPYEVSFSSLFSYPRIGLAISMPVLPSQTQCTATAPAVHCIRSCSALHPSSQCTAFSPQVRASVPASTCIRPCKYVQPSPQVRASVLASTCV